MPVTRCNTQGTRIYGYETDTASGTESHRGGICQPGTCCRIDWNMKNAQSGKLWSFPPN